MILEKIFVRSSLNRLCVFIDLYNKVSFAGFSTPATGSKPCIHLSKTHALLTEKVCVSVTGLQADQKVTLQTFVDKGSKSFGSCGHYIADRQGRVNTFEHECLGGTYDGIEPMGLFWSMQSLPGDPLRRVLNTDVTQPFDVEISLHPEHVDLDDFSWKSPRRQPLASCHFSQQFMNEGVKVIPVKEDGVVGTLYLPGGPGPFPAIIDVFGVTPVVPGHRSSLLASGGIASFNLIYVGQPGLSTSPADMDYTYFLKAFDWLSRHSSIDSSALGGIGGCVGAMYVSIIAWKRPKMRCLVGINSPAHPDGPKQTVEGEMVEKMAPWNWDLSEKIEGAVSWRPMQRVEDNLPPLPYWRHGAKVLHVQCEDDQCANPDCLRASHEVVPQEYRANIEFLSYPGAGHILEPPYVPLCRRSYSSIFESMLLWGGQPKLHAHAQEDAWPRIVDFLHKNLVKQEAVIGTGTQGVE